MMLPSEIMGKAMYTGNGGMLAFFNCPGLKNLPKETFDFDK